MVQIDHFSENGFVIVFGGEYTTYKDERRSIERIKLNGLRDDNLK